MKGKIKWYNRKKGYGFIISPESKKDIFFLPGSCIDDPNDLFPGDIVNFVFDYDRKGHFVAMDILKVDFQIGVLIKEQGVKDKKIRV